VCREHKPRLNHSLSMWQVPCQIWWRIVHQFLRHDGTYKDTQIDVLTFKYIKSIYIHRLITLTNKSKVLPGCIVDKGIFQKSEKYKSHTQVGPESKKSLRDERFVRHTSSLNKQFFWLILFDLNYSDLFVSWSYLFWIGPICLSATIWLLNE